MTVNFRGGATIQPTARIRLGFIQTAARAPPPPLPSATPAPPTTLLSLPSSSSPV